MDLTNPAAPSLEEAVKRFEAGALTDTDAIQMLNTIAAELERGLRLTKILTGAFMLRIEKQAVPAPATEQPVAEVMAPPEEVGTHPVVDVLHVLPEAVVVEEVDTPPVGDAVRKPTEVVASEETNHSASAVLAIEGGAINYHTIVMSLVAPSSLAGGRGTVKFPIYNERIEPNSPDLAAIANEWPLGFYAAGEQTFVRLGDVALLWEHQPSHVELDARPTYAISLPEGSVVHLADINNPDLMRAVIMDISAAHQKTLSKLKQS